MFVNNEVAVCGNYHWLHGNMSSTQPFFFCKINNSYTINFIIFMISILLVFYDVNVEPMWKGLWKVVCPLPSIAIWLDLKGKKC